MRVANGCIVKIEYELRVRGGETIESSAKGGPVVYKHGAGQMLPGLEQRLEGMAVGEEKVGVILAADAFGTESSMPTRQMDRAAFPSEADLRPGRVFETTDAHGRPVRMRVEAIDGARVTVRLLHPLAGRDLEFRARVLSIDDPSQRKRETVPPPPTPADAIAALDESDGDV